ncbi:MAG: methyltransferase domain-containing protein [Thiobacillus sp.]|nr:methyltransferase domain-containing protein [Thiobacillus sp.]
METLESYDALPYESLPMAETQPDVLAAIARLHGFEAPDPRQARILEIGCAEGGNLIPLAWRWPEAHCVGVELSREQAATGNRFIAALGLANVTIAHADLVALPADLGEFDYIIAHGVFSWVPPAVQEALLRVCQTHLSPRGLAYLSFNVEAGWKPLLGLREALLAGTDAKLAAPARCAAARSMLGTLAASSAAPEFADEIAFLLKASPSYFFHEYLDACNSPLRFEDFVSRIDDHALRYVGEASPRHAIAALEDTWGLAPEGMQGRWMDAEAALDDAYAIRFRRALLARGDAACAQPASASALDTLAFYADLGSAEEIDFEHADPQWFSTPAGARIPVAEPVMKAAVMILTEAYPAALPYAELLQSARTLMSEYGVATDAATEQGFRDALFQLVIAHGVMPTVIAGGQTMPPSAQPRAHALARQQAASQTWAVTGGRHLALDLDAAARHLLGLLDGTRSRATLAQLMLAALSDAGAARSLDEVEQLTDQLLWTFARQGLLEA